MAQWMLIMVVQGQGVIAPLPNYYPLPFLTYGACAAVAVEFTPQGMPSNPRVGTHFAICRRIGDETETQESPNGR